MAAPDIEYGLDSKKATQPLHAVSKEEHIITVTPYELNVPNNILIAPLEKTSTMSMEVPTDHNDTAGATPTPPQHTIDIGYVEDEQVLDLLPEAPFFSMGSLLKPFTFSRSPREEGAAFLPPGPDQC